MMELLKSSFIKNRHSKVNFVQQKGSNMQDKMYIPLDITDEQRKNLELLYKNSPKTIEVSEFNMACYFYNKKTEEDIEPHEIKYHLKEDCNTVACFAGLGPSCGIESDTFDNWNDYVDTQFGIAFDSLGWAWLFSGK